MVESESRATYWICSEGNGVTGLSLGVGVTRADTETSGEAVVGTAKMPSRRACLAEGGLEAECLLDDMTIVV